jgi:lipoprotein
MNKKIIIIFLLGLLSCDKQLKITPIYESFNNEAEYNIQYFNISGYKNLSYKSLLDSIILFSENELKSKNLTPPKVKIQNFYQKTLYSPCKDYENIRYEARKGEMGMLRDCGHEMLVAYIWYNEGAEKGVFIRTSTLFTRLDNNNSTADKKIIVSKHDSIKIIENKWILLKKGKINIEQ